MKGQRSLTILERLNTPEIPTQALLFGFQRGSSQQRLNVIIETPDHGRSLPCIRACQAGLDVYAEKPLTAYIAGGRAVVNAARKYGRVFQVGTQQRTMELNRFCCDFVSSGGLVDIKVVQAVNYTGPQKYPGITELPEEAIPDGVDWDTWCGPAPLRPFHHRLQFSWMR